MTALSNYRKSLRRALTVEELQGVLDKAHGDGAIGPTAMEELIGMAVVIRLRILGRQTAGGGA